MTILTDRNEGCSDMITIAVCEDESLDREIFASLIPMVARKLQIECMPAYFSSGEELLNAVKSGRSFDLFILDVFMAGLNGIQAARELAEIAPGAAVSFVTSSRDFAVEAFELNAVHYLLKPVDEKSIEILFNRYLACLNLPNPVIEFETAQGRVLLPVKDTLKIESYKKGVAVYVRGEREPRIVRSSFISVEACLDRTVFLRIARGLTVNMDYIDHISRGICYFTDDTSALISRKEKTEVIAAYNDYLFEKMRKFGGGKVNESGKLCPSVCRVSDSGAAGSGYPVSSL